MFEAESRLEDERWERYLEAEVHKLKVTDTRDSGDQWDAAEEADR